jgi:hypothetical protein
LTSFLNLYPPGRGRQPISDGDQSRPKLVGRCKRITLKRAVIQMKTIDANNKIVTTIEIRIGKDEPSEEVLASLGSVDAGQAEEMAL